MSFIKRASIKAMFVEALNMPESGGWELYNTSRIKVASIDKTKKSDLGGFDLEAALKEHPNHLFVKAFAIKENEVNDNGDAFSPEELKKAAHTFVGCPVFVNHQNDDVEKARGKVVHAWYDKEAEGIYVINRVDKEAYPPLARGIEQGYIQGTSMGAQVSFSCCSICHNRAAIQDEFCSHIKERKNKTVANRNIRCTYHDSSCKPKDECPVCGCKKGESKDNHFKEAKIFEWNYDIKFIEDSFVVNPACHDCLVCDVLNVPKIESKVAETVAKMKVLAERLQESVDSGVMIKTAGIKEINALNDAMNLMEGVARSMMAQKQMVSMEYVSDLVEQLSKLQETADELVQMGYGQLPSPPQSEAMFGSGQAASPIQGGAQQMANPNSIQPSQASMGMSSGGNPQTQPAGNGVATVTRPTFSSSFDTSEKEFYKKAENLQRIGSDISAVQRALSFRRTSVFDTEHTYSASNGEFKVVVAKTTNGEAHVAEFKGDQLLRLTNATAFDGDLQKLIASKPEEAAKSILTMSGAKESSSNMANEKIAAGKGVQEEQAEIITQKQLEKFKTPLHPRQDEHYEAITESDEQLGGKERSNDTTSESPQVRRGSYDVITQAQLESITNGYLTRWGEWPEVITEKQWDEMSRRVDAILPDDWTEQITQAQLINLRDNHRWENPEVITEGQLKDQKGTMPHAGDISRRKSAGTNVESLVKAATSAVSDAIANYGLSPRDIANQIASMTITPQSQMKTAYLTLINAVPSKVSARSDERSRRGYFTSMGAADVHGMKPIDGLLSAMSDNIGYLKAEAFVDAVRRVVSNKTAFAKAEASATAKIASKQIDSDTVNLDSEFNKVFASLDGIYKVYGVIKDDLGVDASNTAALIKSAYVFASKQIGDKKAVLSSFEIDDKTGAFEVVLKDVESCSKNEIEIFAKIEKDDFKTANISNFGDKAAKPFGKKDDKEDDKKNDGEEKEACDDKSASGQGKNKRAAARSEMIKEAQLMGGQMGGGAGGGMGGGMDGGAGGQGASMPQPPGGAGPEVQSFGQDDMGMEEEPDADLQARPPGSHCPVCTSEDVDVVAGKGKCNNCTSEFIFKVSIDVTKWAGLTGDKGDEGEDGLGSLGGPAGAEGEGEGFALPESGGMEESMPVAASTFLKPEALKKMAAAKIYLGSVSPYTGSTRTVYLGFNDGANEFACLNTGMKYQVRTAQKDKNLYVQWEWLDGVREPCVSCNRVRKAFNDGLAKVGIDESKFNSLSGPDRGKAVLSMLAQRSFTKTASKKTSVLNEYKKIIAFTPGNSFPTESCREILARKFGEDAIALSGPDEGDNLADSVCKRLSQAGIYSDRVAVKLASIWGERDGCVECLEDYIRYGFSAEKSAAVCETMKAKYAQAIEMLADEMSQPAVMDGSTPGPIDDSSMGLDGGGGLDGGADPFGAGAEQSGFVTVEVPLDVLQQLDEAFDQALGIDPGAGADPSALPEGDVQIDMPADAVQEIDQVADQALDSAVEVGDVVDQIDGGATEEPLSEEGGSETPKSEGDSIGFEEEVLPGEESKTDDSSGDDDGGDDNNPFGEKHKDKHEEKNEESDNPFAKSNGEKKESSNQSTNEVTKANSEQGADMDVEFMNSLKRSKIAGTGKVTNLDLDLVAKALGLSKKAGDSALQQSNVQDDPDTKPYSGDSTMGHENKFSADEPDVPHKGSGSTMGEEPKELMPEASTTVPAGGEPMGHEGEQGYTPEKGHEFTGGVGGAGSSKAAKNFNQGKTTKAMTSDLASRIVKIAEEKTLKEPAQWKEDSDIGTVSDNKDHSDTPEEMKRTPFEESDNVEVPEAGSGAFMGHEEESIGDVPKSPTHHPKFPAGGGKNPKYDRNEKNTPEKQDHDKGTVIAGSDEESKVARRCAAEKLAGKMVAKGFITAEQISGKINELSRYQVEQIADHEKALFGIAVKKGLDTVAKGAQTPLVIHANKNSKGDPAVELKNKLQSLFTLDRRNNLAEDDPDAQIRRYNH